MPMLTKKGKPKKSELPRSVARSGKRARRTFASAHDSAVQQYGDEERAHRVAYAALKRTHQKVGKRWEKRGSAAPSDRQAGGGASTTRQTAGSVDGNASKQQLYRVAKRLKISGRSQMSKPELVDAIQRATSTSTAKASR
jgi:cation transport regulator ChaB